MKGIHLSGVKKSFRTAEAYSGILPVLGGVDLALPAGQVTVLMGPGQCGKSTLLDVLAGFVRPDEGGVDLDGQRLDYPLGLRCPLVCEKPTMFPWRTVRGNVTFGLSGLALSSDESRERVARCIEWIGLSDYEDYYTKNLPDSLRQLVCYARGMVAQPHAMLLDNPSVGLPAEPRQFFLQRLLRIREQAPVTTLLVSSDVDEAILLGHTINIMAPRPATIIKTLPVDLPEPRERSMMALPVFMEMKQRLLELLDRTQA